jgi:hypothetical protein
MNAIIGRLCRCALHVTLSVVLAACVSGCSDYSKQYDEASTKLVEAQKQNDALENAVKTLKQENAACQQQVATLSVLTPEQKKQAIPTVTDIDINKRSGIYKAESDGKQTKLIVYFRPLDDTGDAIKAAGSVHLELWDLGQQPAQAMLQKWDVSAVELKKMWSGSLLADFYRLAFAVPDDYSTRQNLTVKLTFTDYMTGKVFTPQMAVAGR